MFTPGRFCPVFPYTIFIMWISAGADLELAVAVSVRLGRHTFHNVANGADTSSSLQFWVDATGFTSRISIYGEDLGFGSVIGIKFPPYVSEKVIEFLSEIIFRRICEQKNALFYAVGKTLVFAGRGDELGRGELAVHNELDLDDFLSIV
jgi:hypothetical protein